MQAMREVIRGSLARSLRHLDEEDRLASALPLVCGSTLAARCTVLALDADRVLHLAVDGDEWLHSLEAMRAMVQHDLQRVAGVPLRAVHCHKKSDHFRVSVQRHLVGLGRKRWKNHE